MTTQHVLHADIMFVNLCSERVLQAALSLHTISTEVIDEGAKYQ